MKDGAPRRRLYKVLFKNTAASVDDKNLNVFCTFSISHVSRFYEYKFEIEFSWRRIRRGNYECDEIKVYICFKEMFLCGLRKRVSVRWKSMANQYQKLKKCSTYMQK